MALPAAKFISSVDDFRSVFTTQQDAFLLCYEAAQDGVTPEDLAEFEECVAVSSAEHGAGVSVHVWECASRAFVSAKEQIQKKAGEPLVLIIFRGTVADTLRGPSVKALCTEDIPRVCGRLAAFQKASGVATVVPGRAASSSTPTTAAGSPTMRVDVARMVALGKKMLGEGQAVYAEKFFVKALNVLDEMRPDVYATSARVVDTEDYEGSVAMCLAWSGLAQIVQGSHITNNIYFTRLQGDDKLESFRVEALSDVARACTAHALMLAAPGVWSGETCSQKALTERLRTDPQDHKSRCMLTITLFLSGDLERALTEAVKLKVLDNDFGRVALRKMTLFLGPNHELIQRLGPLTAT